MDGLLSLLLFAGFFYIMMRFGCGAHMVHGHGGGHSGHSAKQVDPVCGMEVQDDAGYAKVYEGERYQFCSRNCLDKFDADPNKYLNQSNDQGGQA